MSERRLVSNRTWALVAFGVAVTAVFLPLIRAGVGGSESGVAAVSNLPSLLTAGAASTAAAWAALRFGRGEGPRRQWLLIALGMCALFVGDTVYAYFEVVAKQAVPFPSAADVFYVASFPLLGIGLLLALLSFRHSLSLVRPVLLAAVATALVTVAVWASVFGPVLAGGEDSPLARVLGLFYPVGDFWLLIFPALALAMALSRLGRGRLAWPWWAVGLGFVLISAADTLFAVATNNGSYATGSPIDAGWWLGYAAIAVGASLAADVQRPREGGAAS